ncbi:Meiotic nuclear division protein 1-like [Hondaea fermentalgiana]|uniref:Meiotic nuclear division protein 1-like n=1 Tax=Hondaea fermentalgiana TaxID=2315210 RepID=A0A2R5GG16_9STRA|nr:Meiotic nuclear division protein 1-like [Hondaea fermentalgiana]|eukprot:GBG29545.1 Meiotic nuclear division protein 1-like [Hondaea fermentalgiana]
MGKRGLSLEEKKERIKGILQEKKEPFTLKQIEKVGAKAGVAQMSIKGVLEEMVSDNLVCMDKIGSTNWFWSFPSEQKAGLQAKLKRTTEELQAAKESVAKARAEKEALLAARVPSESRQAKLAELAELRQKAAATAEDLGKLRENDPAQMVELVRKIDVCKEAANRWTDNTWTLMDYVRKKYGKQKKEVMQWLEMKDDFDYPVFTQPKKRARKA